MIGKVCTEFGFMRGLLLEFTNLLRVMKHCGIEGCDQCLEIISEASRCVGPDSPL